MRGAHAVLPERGFNVSELMPPQQAVIGFLARAALPSPKCEEVRLQDASGRILARDISADREYPAVHRSAMDGFAVRCADTPGTFKISGEVVMGRLPARALREREAFRIPTGGPLPDGADAVVPVEHTTVAGGEVTILSAVPPMDCVTPRGDDMQPGELILRAGRRIGGAEAAVLATLGIARVLVYRKPRAGVISSGDELVEIGGPADPAQIRDSNRYAIGAALERYGCEVLMLPTVGDRAGALEDALEAALALCDAVFVTGGSSVGVADRTPVAINRTGKPGVIVHGLRVKPGKPTVLAAIGVKPIIGLPGNPTSALMILHAVMAPVIAALTGAAQRPPLPTAVMEKAIEGRAGWTWFVPVFLRDDGENYHARPLTIRSSSASLPARAHGFITIDEKKTTIARAELVRVHPLSEGLI